MVTRVEPPAKTEAGDIGGARYSPDAQNLHRNKRGMCLNLKHPQGLAVFLKLVAQADVVVYFYAGSEHQANTAPRLYHLLRSSLEARRG
jgi:crotonobetainyl-CoA:carnitine CoA-transferase CaiB-like acyl-CoA transferase